MPKSRGRKPKKKKAQQTAVASKKSAPLAAVSSKKSAPLTGVAIKKSAPLTTVASEKRAPPTTVASEKSAWTLLPSRLFAGFLAICTIVGLIVFWPRLIVEAVGQIDPLRPFPITFKVTNTGFIPLESVQPAIGLCDFWTGSPKNLPDQCNGPLGPYLQMPQWFVSTLARDETTEVRLDDLFNIIPPAQFGAADISIKVAFNPWIIPIHWQREFRFQTRLERDGKLSWIARPLNK
jgi:hypothetical protein